MSPRRNRPFLVLSLVAVAGYGFPFALRAPADVSSTASPPPPEYLGGSSSRSGKARRRRGPSPATPSLLRSYGGRPLPEREREVVRQMKMRRRWRAASRPPPLPTSLHPGARKRGPGGGGEERAARRSPHRPVQAAQSSVCSPGTRANSRSFAVTNVAPRRRACAAMRMS